MPAAFHDEGHGYDVFGMHPDAVARFAQRAAPLYDRYFRVTSYDIGNVPPAGPTILVANHAGVLPVDGAVLWLDVLRHLEPLRYPRPIADHFVPRLPFVGTAFARAGVVSGTRANVARLLARGELLLLWPEGVSGPAKHFRDRYQLQDWHVGFAELALRHRAAVVPVALIGGEESWPLAARLGVRWFGAPYLPIPWVPLPLPAHYRIAYGEPIRFAAPPEAADDPEVVAAIAAQVRDVLARDLAHLRMARRGVFR